MSGRGGVPAPGALIDVHHHFVPEAVHAQLRAMAGGAGRLVNDQISITLPANLSDAEAHLEAMDAAGIVAALLTYSGLSVLGSDLCRSLNEGFAELGGRYAGRFVGTAHVDLRDPAAPAELERAVGDFGFPAVALPCSAGEVDLDDPSLDPLWEMVDHLATPVILHPALRPRGATTAHGLERSCARPFDTTMAAVRLLCSVLPRYPDLRFVLPHCGGTAVFLKGRLLMFFAGPDHSGGRTLPRTRREQALEGLDAIFEASWSRLYFDTAGTGAWAPAVAFTAGVVGSDRLMFGSDFPLESHSPDTLRELVDMLASLDLSDGDRRAVATGTAADLFGLRLPP